MSLPIVDKPHHPLIFKKYELEDVLIQRGKYKILEPTDDKQQVIPDVMLVPLVGFTEKCERLGYGGGFYDRTIHLVKQQMQRQLLTIGVAFEA